jgi:hypothetical protein
VFSRCSGSTHGRSGGGAGFDALVVGAGCAAAVVVRSPGEWFTVAARGGLDAAAAWTRRVVRVAGVVLVEGVLCRRSCCTPPLIY